MTCHIFTVQSDEQLGEWDRVRDVARSKPQRFHSITAERLPVQEAMKNGNSANFFNALRYSY